MKLFTKYNRINVLSTVIIFLLGCIAFSVLLRYVVIGQIDEDLKIEKNEILTYVTHNNRLPGIIEVHDQYTTYKNIPAPNLPADKIYTHEAYDAVEHEKELRRTIDFNINVNNTWYLVSVSKSLEGTDDLIQTIIGITITLILLILITTFFINRIVLRRLWQPFNETLQAMQQFNVSEMQTLKLNNTKTDEFNHLNSILNNTMGKAQQDYKTLKEFTENASHELQTPIAVIQAKLDMLIQNEKLSEAESKNIQSAYSALQNLSKLNQSLLLLAKIENRQFTEKVNIELPPLIHSRQIQFAEQWENKHIAVDADLNKATITGNQRLVEILLNNLFSNATWHNINNGIIVLQLRPKYFKITNTGYAQPLDEQQVFNRFYKGNTESARHGIGLSIVQQICKASGYICRYQFQQPNLHSFIVSWE